MKLEHALLAVRQDRVAAFRSGLAGVLPQFAAMPGLHLLLVRWRSLEDHVEGFRGSDRYPRWKALLHHFYDPFPEVLHFGPPVAEAGPADPVG